MRTLISTLQRLAVSTILAVVLSACAIGRSVIEVSPPASATSGGIAAVKIAVKITEVRDLRRFSINPRDPSQPSLGDAAEINDPKVTARAVGRKRGGFGAALGDVTVPEGTTVAGLVREAARTALQDKGYRIVGETSPDYAAALPLALDVEEFWAWFTPGFVSVTASFKTRVIMTGGPLVRSAREAVDAGASRSVIAVTEAVWTDVIQTGLVDLVAKMRERIRDPSEIPR
ncbi:MAG TPA: flagellar biosynthesis protein [Alphaproteobacteria bacterium]|nr:flagellar biosynthesis protein [Alphaproteobacteria bacterium]